VIAIVDYGLGNLTSVRNAFAAVGAEVMVTSDRAHIEAADGVVLPGVGAAGAGMAGLRARGLIDVVRGAAATGTPLLGHCLGMQLLFEWSEENGGTECLGVLGGTVRRMQGEVKIPHIGWNQVQTRTAPIWDGVPADPYFYFVHSYVCVPTDQSVVAGTTDYAGAFCSAIVSGSLWGAQFHPERSGATGLVLIDGFVQTVRERSARILHDSTYGNS
jgi:imidazole glycerol-phosphate synthase subunit HisH